nr:HpaA family protein [uncultured Sulfurimonas sp.]
MNKKTLLSAVMALTLLTGCGTSFVSMKPLELSKDEYAQTDSEKGIAFAIARPQLMIKTKMSPDLNRGLNRRLQYDANAISCHLTSEIERMLVARGITITNVFESINDMTFTQKKETTALLYPVITISILQESNTVYQEGHATNTNGDIKVRVDAGVVMLEPLSGEKIWVKHVYAGKKDLLINYNGFIENNPSPFKIQTNVEAVANNIDALLIEIDNQILNAVSKHVTKEEFKYLNDDIKKLKGIKRY